MNNAARTDSASVECSGTSEDPLCGLRDRIQSNIRLNLLVLAVASAKEDRPAPGASASFHIAPPVSHHETPSEIDSTSDGACVPTAGAISAESHTTANSDLAEVYPSDELLEEGDVVVRAAPLGGSPFFVMAVNR
jgi:hypothetical protein